MKKWLRILVAVLLICGMCVCLYGCRSVPIKSMILPDGAEQNLAAVAVRRMEGSDSQTCELHDPSEIAAAAACFQNVRVRHQGRADMVPVDPVLYGVTFVTSEQGPCPKVDIAADGSVYMDGARYRIVSGDEAAVLSYLEGLFPEGQTN